MDNQDDGKDSKITAQFTTSILDFKRRFVMSLWVLSLVGTIVVMGAITLGVSTK